MVTVSAPPRQYLGTPRPGWARAGQERTRDAGAIADDGIGTARGAREHAPRRAVRIGARRSRPTTTTCITARTTRSTASRSTSPTAQHHGHHRPIGLRQEHAAALVQSHERPDPGRSHHRRAARRRARRARRRHRRRGSAAPRGHGVPAAESVSAEHLRQRRVRPAPARASSRAPSSRRASRPAFSAAALWNEVRDRLRPLGASLSGGQQQRLCIARCLAIEPDGDPDGRAGLGARSHRDRAHRRAGADAQVALHDRGGDAQHAAGGAHLRPHRVHARGRADRDGRHLDAVHPARARSSPRTTSPGASDERHAWSDESLGTTFRSGARSAQVAPAPDGRARRAHRAEVHRGAASAATRRWPAR